MWIFRSCRYMGSYAWAPSVIIAAALLVGCLTGSTLHHAGSYLAPAAMTVISVLATIQPTPLALSAAGLTAGLVLETARNIGNERRPKNDIGERTFKGKVVRKYPGYYNRTEVRIDVKEMLGIKRKKVNFLMDIPFAAGREVSRGASIILRTSLQSGDGTFPNAMRGRMASGGWIRDSERLSLAIKGRERMSLTVDSNNARRSQGLLSSFALGERWRVDNATRNILRKTGTFHLMAVSGVHVGAAVLPAIVLLRFYNVFNRRPNPLLNRLLTLVLSSAAVCTYLLYTGISSSALRAAVFILISGSAVLFTRNPAPLVSLSWCAMIIASFSNGRQPDIALLLSVAAVAGLILSAAGEKEHGPRGFFSESLRMTIGATLFTTPLSVWLADGLSVLAPIGNLVAGISFGLFLIPLAVLLDLAALIPWFSLDPLVSIWLVAADEIVKIMDLLAGVPLSFTALSHIGCIAASLSAITGVLLWIRYRYNPYIGLAIYLTVILFSWSVDFMWQLSIRDELRIDFPSMGQADGAIIRYGGSTVLIDCGPPGLPGRTAPAAVALRNLGIKKVDALFLSHAHPDHAGGLEDIAAFIPVRSVYLPDDGSEQAEWKRKVTRTVPSASVEILRYGDVVSISSISYKIVGPRHIKTGEVDINRGSMQILLEGHGRSALFTGDAGWDQVLVSLEGIRSLDLLKIPHHGSRFAFPPSGIADEIERLSKTAGFTAVSPSDIPGKRSLPAPEVVQWFHKRGIMLVYTGNNDVNFRYNKPP